MKRLPILLLTLSLVSCGVDETGETPTAGETTGEAEAQTSTADRAVENVTRAQAKAREIAAEENERAEEVDEAMKDQ